MALMQIVIRQSGNTRHAVKRGQRKRGSLFADQSRRNARSVAGIKAYKNSKASKAKIARGK